VSSTFRAVGSPFIDPTAPLRSVEGAPTQALVLEVAGVPADGALRLVAHAPDGVRVRVHVPASGGWLPVGASGLVVRPEHVPLASLGAAELELRASWFGTDATLEAARSVLERVEVEASVVPLPQATLTVTP